MSAGDLGGFFDLLERAGLVRLPLSALCEAVPDAGARAALAAAGIAVPGADAESLPCAHRAGCARDVRRADDGHRRLVAICGQSPPECDPIELAEQDVATVRLALSGLTATMRKLLSVRPSAGHATHATKGSARAREPIALGVQERRAFGEVPRDAFLALRPEDDATPAWLTLRERVSRPAVVFVPTARRIASEVLARHAAGDRVEIVALEDALVVKNGAIALSARAAGPALHVVRAAIAAPEVAPRDEEPRRGGTRRDPLRKTRGLELPPVKKWRELRACLLDGETLRFDGAGKYARCSYQDLGFGMTSNRSKARRDWTIVIMVCEGDGILDWAKFDRKWDVARKYVSNVNKRMKELFGIDDDAFEQPKDGIYRSKFRARVGLPGEMGKG